MTSESKGFKPDFRVFWSDFADYWDFRLDFVDFICDFRTFVDRLSEVVCPSTLTER